MHNDYSLAPEKLEIGRDILPRYCSDIADQYNIKTDGIIKLVPNLCNKGRHFLHYRNLQLYLSLGMKMIGGHRIWRFKQSDWLKSTLILIAIKERMLLIVLKRIFFKLINNSVYSKTMENLRKIVKVRLVNNAEDYKK